MVAFDEDDGDVVTFSLQKDVHSPFSINSSTGELYVDMAVLDFETKSVYEVDIVLEDRAGAKTIADPYVDDAERLNCALHTSRRVSLRMDLAPDRPCLISGICSTA